MRLSPHFTLDELTRSQTAARFGIDNSPPPDVLENLKKTAVLLEEVRKLCGAPVIVSSGYRSPELNRRIGGTVNSQHISGRAADFTVIGQSLDDVMEMIIDSDIRYDQLIIEFNSWLHISWADTPRLQALEIDRNGTTLYT